MSVITAVGDTPPSWLLDAYRALIAQSLQRWEWILQADGTEHAVPPEFEADPRISVDTNRRWLGTAITRNRALIRSRASLVQSLDSDDQLLPEALELGVEAMRNPEIAFAIGDEVERWPDGSDRVRRAEINSGLVGPGQLERDWRTSGRLAISLRGITWRRSLVLAYGGWTALAGFEDTCLALSIAQTHPAWLLGRPTVVARIHRAQTVLSEDFRLDRPINRAFVHQRLNAMRQLRGEEVPAEYQHPPADTAVGREVERARSLQD